MKIVLIISICIFTQLLTAQTETAIRKALEKVETIGEVTALIDKHVGWEIKFKDIASVGFFGDSIIGSANELSIHERDYEKTGIHYLAKVILKKEQEFCKLKYILVQRNSMDSEELDVLQNEIISKHESGSSIQDLVDEYNQDGNPTGELGWFPKGMTVPDFENAVWARKKNDVFKVNIPSKNWYYVVFKTHENERFEVSSCAVVTICKNGCEDQEQDDFDHEAYFPGGEKKLDEFIANNYSPTPFEDTGIEDIIISFMVEEDGSLTDINVQIGINETNNAEALHVINSMPKWKPKVNGGKTVRSIVRLHFPINLIN
ncbi:MAG: hypothetical protein ACI837_002837 [Crocinitomicaceae bacterium]|jgi:hypothetical protein